VENRTRGDRVPYFAMPFVRHPTEEIGRGRAAVVYRTRDDRQRTVACKVFTSHGLTKAVLYVLTGAPNPYSWSEHAIRAALNRREVLAGLVQYWFDDKLRLPKTHGVAWNEEHRAYELNAEFIDGSHVPLRCTSEASVNDPLDDLVHRIMEPLQRRLIEAGMDGLVWQAGLGNPVAASNFMLERKTTGEARWVWIDLESGVPALFPLNPLALLRFYWPRSWQHGRLLFDDVDIAKLREYLKQHEAALDKKLGTEPFRSLLASVDELESHQREWKQMRRTTRSIAYCRAKRRITAAEAEWYADRPLRWHARLLQHGAASAARRVVAASKAAWRWCARLDVGRAVRFTWRFAASQRFRRHVARRLVSQRIASWQERQFLDRRDAARLRNETRNDEAASYVADFGVHLALNPISKIIRWWILPALFALGVINGTVLFVGLAAGGPIIRTMYSMLRVLEAAVAGQRCPWVALAAGVLPGIGNAAYPMQLVHCSSDRRRRLAQFILFDAFAAIGRAVPIWGGPNSLIEAWSNRLPHAFMRTLQRLRLWGVLWQGSQKTHGR